MKKILFIIFLCSLIYPEWLQVSQEQAIKRNYFLNEHSWLTERLYDLYVERSIQYEVPLKLALSVVEAESNGRKIISRMNRNGTRDYGRFQINSIHMPKNPKKLLNDYYNSEYGFWYLSKCLEKSKGNISETIRMYNQGINGNKKHYRNWRYVEKILICYNRGIINNKR